LAFWKVHILHHAGEELLHGQWMFTELRRHGYAISPGTLYPLLQRMERIGWLKGKASPRRGRARKDYRLTAQGRKVLGVLREQIAELYDEVVRGIETKGKE
jgi:DNA-binding PadR family transcriptional regulator